MADPERVAVAGLRKHKAADNKLAGLLIAVVYVRIPIPTAFHAWILAPLHLPPGGLRNDKGQRDNQECPRDGTTTHARGD